MSATYLPTVTAAAFHRALGFSPSQDSDRTLERRLLLPLAQLHFDISQRRPPCHQQLMSHAAFCL